MNGFPWTQIVKVFSGHHWDPNKETLKVSACYKFFPANPANRANSPLYITLYSYQVQYIITTSELKTYIQSYYFVVLQVVHRKVRVSLIWSASRSHCIEPSRHWISSQTNLALQSGADVALQRLFSQHSGLEIRSLYDRFSLPRIIFIFRLI